MVNRTNAALRPNTGFSGIKNKFSEEQHFIKEFHNYEATVEGKAVVHFDKPFDSISLRSSKDSFIESKQPEMTLSNRCRRAQYKPLQEIDMNQPIGDPDSLMSFVGRNPPILITKG